MGADDGTLNLPTHPNAGDLKHKSKYNALAILKSTWN